MCQNIFQIGNPDLQFAVFVLDLLAFQTGQSSELHVEDGLGLDFIQTEAFHQPRLGFVGVPGSTDGVQHFVHIVDSDPQALQDMGPCLGFFEVIPGSSGNDFILEADIALQHLFHAGQLRRAVDQDDVVDAEVGLHRGQPVQLVQQDFRLDVLAQLHDNPDAVHVGLIPQVGNAFNDLVPGQGGNAFHHGSLVHHIRQFVDNDAALAVGHFLHPCLGPHDDRAAAGLKGIADAGTAENIGPGREVRSLDVFHQFRGRHVRILHQGNDAVDGFPQVVRGDVGGHADGDAAGAVDNQIREPGRQDSRLFFLTVIVIHHVHGFLIEIADHLHGDLGHSRFRVTHGGCAVTVHGTEVAVPVDQGLAHVPVLRHVDQSAVDGTVTVRVVFTHGVTDNTRTFPVRLVRPVVHFVHGVENSSLHRLQPVADIRQGPGHDDGHRVFQKVPADFLSQFCLGNVSRVKVFFIKFHEIFCH